MAHSTDDAPLPVSFSPKEALLFTKAVNRETFKATMHIRNESSALVVFKIKTNKADRYAVKPHLHVLMPGETICVAFTVVTEHTHQFVEDMERQKVDVKKHTAFLVLVWSPNESVAARLQNEATMLADEWKKQEVLDKESGTNSFLSQRFPADYYDDENDESEVISRSIEAEHLANEPSAWLAGRQDLDARHGFDAGELAAVAPVPPSAGGGAGKSAGAPAPVRAPHTSHDSAMDGLAPAHDAHASGMRSSGGSEGLPSGIMTSEQAMNMRAEITALSGDVLTIRGENEHLKRAVDNRDKELQGMRARLQAAEAAAAAAADGLRKRAVAAGRSDEKDKDSDEEDANEAGQLHGFPLWQIVIVAVVCLLLGRLSISYL